VYLDYAMSVIVRPGFADVRDGSSRCTAACVRHGTTAVSGPTRLLEVRARRRRRDGPVHHMATRRSTTPSSSRPAVVARYPWSMGRQLRLAGQRPGRRHALQQSAGWHRWPWRWSATSTRTPSTSRRTRRQTQEPDLLPSRFPNLLVNALPASPSAWPPTSRRTTCARWRTASSGCWPTRSRDEELLGQLLLKVKGPDSRRTA